MGIDKCDIDISSWKKQIISIRIFTGKNCLPLPRDKEPLLCCTDYPRQQKTIQHNFAIGLLTMVYNFVSAKTYALSSLVRENPSLKHGICPHEDTKPDLRISYTKVIKRNLLITQDTESLERLDLETL